MENTKSNKSRFFAQYWGQKVLYVGGVGLEPIGTKGWNLKHPDFFLELTPLSQISDEDAIEVAKRMSYYSEYFVITRNENEIHIVCDDSIKVIIGIVKFGLIGKIIEDEFDSMFKKSVVYYEDEIVSCIDYLRSKGYALPWMDISIETLIEWGWVKLKSDKS